MLLDSVRPVCSLVSVPLIEDTVNHFEGISTRLSKHNNFALAKGIQNRPLFKSYNGALNSFPWVTVPWMSYSSPRSSLSYDAVAWRSWMKNKINMLGVRMGRNVKTADRKRVVVLGTGWGSISFLSCVDFTKYDVTVISPNNYFNFTPFLPSVCGGALSPRSAVQPVRPLLQGGGREMMKFIQAEVVDIDVEQDNLLVTPSTGPRGTKGQTVGSERGGEEVRAGGGAEVSEVSEVGEVSVQFDYLVMGIGSSSTTNGVGGVKEHCHFLKDVKDASRIHQSIIRSLEYVSSRCEGMCEEEKRQRLHFVVVGCLPGSCETIAVLSDLIKRDVSRLYPQAAPYITLSLLTSSTRLVPMFPTHASQFAKERLERIGVNVRLCTRVVNVNEHEVEVMPHGCEQVEKISFGVCIWMNGNETVDSPLVRSVTSQLSQYQTPRTPFSIDSHLRLKGAKGNIFCLGDCARIQPGGVAELCDSLYEEGVKINDKVDKEYVERKLKELVNRYPQVEKPPSLPSHFDTRCLTKDQLREYLTSIDSGYRAPAPTAQNAKFMGYYLAGLFNKGDPLNTAEAPVFLEKWRGAMAYLGDGCALVHTPWFTMLGGITSNLLWRLTYWGMQPSATNRVSCVFDWLSLSFGKYRDTVDVSERPM